MTPNRVTGPGPRTIALQRAATLIASLLLASLVIACGTSVGPSASGPSPTIGLPGSSGGGLPAGSSGAAGSPGVAGPGPSRPRWPGTTVLAVIALGAADGEIQKAGADLQKAADTEDLKAMWGAADGLAKMIEALMPNLDRLDAYPGTQPVAALYRVAFPEMAAGAKQLRDAITSGDAAGIAAGYQQIAKAAQSYAPIRRQIGALVEQAIVQQRLYLK